MLRRADFSWFSRSLISVSILLVFLIVFSFQCISSWTRTSCVWHIYIEHELICVTRQPSGITCTGVPAIGGFQTFQSGVYEPWRMWPDLFWDSVGFHFIKFPLHIFVFVLILSAGVSAYSRVQSRIRMQSGLCPKCDYDLTGNTSGVCPECGTLINRSILKSQI